MKALGTLMVVTATSAVSMAAGAYLVMNNKCARKIYRMGKKKAMELINM